MGQDLGQDVNNHASTQQLKQGDEVITSTLDIAPQVLVCEAAP